MFPASRNDTFPRFISCFCFYASTGCCAGHTYDAVVVGTSKVVEMMPEYTGLPSPFSILTNIDIDTCASRGLCIEEASTDSAAHVASSVITEFRLMPASIVTALENIVEDIEAGVEIGRTVSNTMNGGLSL